MTEDEYKHKAAEIGADVVELAVDMKVSITRVMDISIDEQISVLRDVIAMSLAGLGAAVTLLTVGGASKLIQTPSLFYLAVVALGTGLMYAQWAREKLINYHTELNLAQEKQYAELKNAAAAISKDPLNESAKDSLRRALQTSGGTSEVTASAAVLHGHRYSYKIGLLGLLLLGVSLVLDVTLPL